MKLRSWLTVGAILAGAVGLQMFAEKLLSQIPENYNPKFQRVMTQPGDCANPGDLFFRLDTSSLGVCDVTRNVVSVNIGTSELFTTVNISGFDATDYLPLYGAVAFGTTQGGQQVPIPSAGALKSMYVSFSAGVGGSSFTATLQNNGSDTTLTCTMTSSGAKGCNDSTHVITVAVGDLLNYKIVKSGSIGVVGSPVFAIITQFNSTTR